MRVVLILSYQYATAFNCTKDGLIDYLSKINIRIKSMAKKYVTAHCYSTKLKHR